MLIVCCLKKPLRLVVCSAPKTGGRGHRSGRGAAADGQEGGGGGRIHGRTGRG